MFDCVDKQSEIKNDTYNYDYAIKTSQNIENADIATADNETNYELSEDGQCPLNCKQCLENKKCIKCRKDFELVGTKNEEKMECIQKDKLKTGYYFSDSIYYKCIEFCEKCIDDTSCENCLANYTYFNNFCMPNIQNCEEYNNNKKCIKNAVKIMPLMQIIMINVLVKKKLMIYIIQKTMVTAIIYVMEKGKIIFKIVVNALIIRTITLN